MELQHCKICGHAVSINADSCPQCGDPDPVNRKMIAELNEKREVKQGCLGIIKHGIGLYIYYTFLVVIFSLLNVNMDNWLLTPISLLVYALLVILIKKVKKRNINNHNS